MLQEKYKDAAATLETAIDTIHCIFKNDEIIPPIHHREHGDLYMLLAEIYLKDKNTEKALFYLSKMVDYDLTDYEMINNSTATASPLLNLIPHGLYQKRIDRHENLLKKLEATCFNSIKGTAAYIKLLKRVKEKA